MAELLGKRAFDSFSSFRILAKGISASNVEALASALAAQAESSSPLWIVYCAVLWYIALERMCGTTYSGIRSALNWLEKM